MRVGKKRIPILS